MPSHKNDRCRYCGSRELECFLQLGDQPPADSFIRADLVHLPAGWWQPA